MTGREHLKMRTLVTGANGMLAHEVLREFRDREPIALSRSALDITDRAAVESAIQPGDAVINCAAYNAVDDAESNPSLAFAINSDGPAILAEVLRERGGTLVHVSTDYVFDGTAHRPRLETDERTPASVYGRSKAEGEMRALAAHPDGTYVVRTAWLYGADGNNFARTMLKLARERDEIRVVTDQVGQPTWTADLAVQIRRLLDTGAPLGVYHGTNAGQASWFEFARAVLTEAGLDPEIIQPTTSAEFPRPAKRPEFSVLSHDRWIEAGIPPMREWRSALHAAFQADVFDASDSGAA